MQDKENNTTGPLEEITPELEDMIPQMNVSVPGPEGGDVSNLIADNELLGVYDEIMSMIRDDRVQVNDFIDNFANCVINDGDSTPASKEALVNLVKVKSDMADKMVKIADLMTRIKLKERDTFPRYLAAKQENHINIGSGTKRSLLEAIHKATKKKDNK